MNKYLKEANMKKKIISVMAVMIGLFLIAIVASFIGLTSLNNKIRDFYRKPFVNSNLQMEIQKDVQYVAKNVLWAMTTDDPLIKPDKIKKVNDTTETIEKNIMKLHETFPEQNLLDMLDSAGASLKNTQSEVMKLIEEDKDKDLENSIRPCSCSSTSSQLLAPSATTKAKAGSLRGARNCTGSGSGRDRESSSE